MIRIFSVAAMMLGLLLGGAVQAQQSPQGKRVILEPKHRSVVELLKLLTPLYQGEAVLLGDPTTSTIIVRGPAAVVDEVQAIFGQLDRPARNYRVTLVLAEIPVEKDAQGKPKPGPTVDLGKFSGKAEQVLAAIETLENQGTLANVHRFALNAGENRTGVFKQTRTRADPNGAIGGFGGAAGKGFPGGAAGNPAGGFRPRTARGTITESVAAIQVDLMPGNERGLLLDLKINDLASATTADGGSTNLNLTTSLQMPAGEARLLQDTSRRTENDRERFLVIVVVEPRK